MGYILGTDEAGYGPNLGPLVIAATLWEAPDAIDGEQLMAHVGHAIAARVSDVSDEGPYVAMADSKVLYTSGKGLRHLERGLWAAFGLLEQSPGAWCEVWKALAPESLGRMSHIPWYADYDEVIVRNGAQTIPSVEILRDALVDVGVRLVAMQCRVVFADEFNDLVEQYDSKGLALSHETLALAARMINPLAKGPIRVVCDKHGGRNTYGSLLQEHFPGPLVEVYGESRERSLYRFGPADRRVEFCFRTKAESCLPAALASMAAKYLRESAMHAFNRFWQHRLPGLQPTAGYPEDAKRFRADIAGTQAKHAISDRLLWRCR